MPRLPVHVLLMRGRLPGPPLVADRAVRPGQADHAGGDHMGKGPAGANRVTVAFEAPGCGAAGAGRRCGAEAVRRGRAIRSRARRRSGWWIRRCWRWRRRRRSIRCPSFIVERPSRMAARDTRNMAFGIIPLQENPGRRSGQREAGHREHLGPAQFHAGADLPATCEDRPGRGGARPGEAAGHADRVHAARQGHQRTGPVRLRHRPDARPPTGGRATGAAALPAARATRSRPKCSAASSRGRAARAPRSLSVDGLTATGAKRADVRLERGGAGAKARFPVSVPQPAPGKETAKIRFLVRRDSDQVGDAVEIALPIRPDRPVVHERRLVEIAPGASADLPAPPGDVRPGSYAGVAGGGDRSGAGAGSGRAGLSARLSVRLHRAAHRAGVLGTGSAAVRADRRSRGIAGPGRR